ncbi:MAG: hypothetical protein PHR06_15935 [Candidatus Cloacimonetes bacterium]|nr:hypothetical protein [Candidatus Cloacimonadota bacterium]
MNDKVYLRIPVKIHYVGWADALFVVIDSSLIIDKQKIPFGEIKDLEYIDVDRVNGILIKNGLSITLLL